MLDIIIVNYESSEFLDRCLRSVYDSSNGIPINVFVQDNSPNNGIDSVGVTFPQINLKKNRYNMGFARAANRALARGSAPYILLLNPDTMVSDGFFESVLRYIEDNEDTGIVGPKILNLDGTVQGSARSFPTPLTALFGRASLLTKLFPNNRISSTNILTSKSDGRTPMEVDWVSGACILLRRQALNDVGYLDERFFIYWEDTDWCRRMWQKGWKVVYFPQTSVLHHVGGSTRKKPIRSIFEFHKSVYRLFTKYNKPSLRFLNPLVIGALALRLTLALFVNRIGSWSGKLRSFIRACF
jgi:GT2 family glycosyltransferase